MQGDVFAFEIEFAHQEVEDLVADVGRDFEAHRLVESSTSEFHFDGFEQVIGFFFFNSEVAVAADPERGPVLDDHADEEPIELRANDLLSEDEPTGRAADQPREHVGHLEASKSPITSLGVGHIDGQRQRKVRDVGKRVARVDRQRGEDREHPLFVEVVELGAFLGGRVIPVDDLDARSAEFGNEVIDERCVELLDHFGHPDSDRCQLLRRCTTVPGRLIDAGDQLVFERCNSDLEELVEVGRRNGTELCTFEQRDPRLGRELQDPFVETRAN